MPFAGFICEATNEKVSPEDCLACARTGGKDGCHFTPPVIRGLIANNNGRGYVGVSVTQLLACPRKVRLQREHPYWVRPSELYWAFRGRLGHALVEHAHGQDNVLAEVRFSMHLDGTLITGQPDVVYLDRGHLVDYKTTKAVPGPWLTYTCSACGKVMKEGRWPLRHTKTPFQCPHCGTKHPPRSLKGMLAEGPPRPYGHHIQQVNLYRLLLARNGIEVRSLEIVYLDMARMMRVPVRPWPLGRAEAFARERLRPLLGAELPPPLAEEDNEHWQCQYCSLASICREEATAA